MNIQLQAGDILLMKDGAALGKLAYIDMIPGAACLNSHLLLFRPINASYWPKFLYYYLSTPLFQDHILVRATGATFLGVSQEAVGNHEISLPPVEEQCAIATFLDRKTAAIDALIAKKERLLALLEEKRQALITQAVTKGLDPSAPMKDSGVEWLGEVPAGWRVGQLGKFIQLQRGIDITGAAEVEQGYPVISSGGFSGKTERAAVKGPGVVIGRKGTLGTVFYVEGGYWPHDTTLWVREFRGSLSRFVFFVLRHLALENLDTGAANPTLNRNLVHPIQVSWPPLDEQISIASFLDDAEAKQERINVATTQQIEKLREYRQALITAAVTGKLDVAERLAQDAESHDRKG
jgi:type I restriction enzyme S subunit